ncbi:MAG: BspA family leucine-rich repeat surface protein [Bacteroidaceae bacterium]|nr:BspA family leucine-rich repeat surface protein [Bacteroidaceae bacterium]
MKHLRLLLSVLLLLAVGTVEVKAVEAYVSYDNGTLTFYFDNYRSSHTTTYDLDGWVYEKRPWVLYHQYDITSAVFDSSFANADPTTTSHWFEGCLNLTSITGLEFLNTSSVTSTIYMFKGCTSLTSLDLSNFNAENVEHMNSMF